MFKTLKKAQDGFTIIELLIVIAIIAVLAGLVLNNFQGAQAKARDTQRLTDINNIHSKLEEFYNEKGFYPDTFEADDFPGIDEDSLIDPDGAEIVKSAPVANEAGATVEPDSIDEYIYIPFPTSCTTVNEDCEGYVLKSYIEKPTASTTNPYVKKGLNNPATP